MCDAGGPVRIDAGRGRGSRGGPAQREREFSVYAIVRCGGRQEKASVDDVLTVDKLAGDVGSSVTLPAVLVIDDGKVISDPAEVGGYQVTAEILGAAAGPKINMIHYKNKTGYRRRLGHRQKYTQVKITGIGAPKAAPGRPAPRPGRRTEMAHKKGASSSRNGRDSNAQRLGVKRFGGQLGGRGRDHRAPARDALPPRYRRRPWRRRHAVCPGRREGRVRQAARAPRGERDPVDVEASGGSARKRYKR